MLAVPKLVTTGNRILDSLPQDELASLARHLETVRLEKGEDQHPLL